MKNAYKNYYIEEWIVDGDLQDIFSCLSLGKILLTTRIRQCFLNKKIEFGKSLVINNPPNFLNLKKIVEPCKIHYLVIVDKNIYNSNIYKKSKVILLKMLKNKDFIKDKNEFIKNNDIKLFNTWSTYIQSISSKMGSEEYRPFLALITNYLMVKKLLNKYNIPEEYDVLLRDLLLLENKFILDNYNDIVSADINHASLSNSLIYLIRNNDGENISLNCEAYGDTTQKDINNSFISIRYFQDKYYKNLIKMRDVKKIDNYFKLYKLDTTGVLAEWKKADEIFGVGEEDPITKETPLITLKEEKKRKNRIKTMRKRLREI